MLRRRGAGASSASGDERDGAGESAMERQHGRSGASTPVLGGHDVVERHTGSGSVHALDVHTGRRLAYDPRDLVDAAEESAMPRLTIMEEVLLLGLKDRQGYLSFWNDRLSFVLRGCLLMELALRGRLDVAFGGDQRHADVSDRAVRVTSTKRTGEPLLDEALRLMHGAPPASIANWMDYLSGETWNILKLDLQLKQLRERLAKGLVDKGILRTEKRNFLLFDMPTHPVADMAAKDAVRRRVYALTTASSVQPAALYKEDGPVAAPVTRTLCVVCSALCADVLSNVFQHLSVDVHDTIAAHVRDLSLAFGQWPMAPDAPGGGIPPRGALSADAAPSLGHGSKPKRRAKTGVGLGELTRHMRAEFEAGSPPAAAWEIAAAVLHVFLQMDALA